MMYLLFEISFFHTSICTIENCSSSSFGRITNHPLGPFFFFFRLLFLLLRNTDFKFSETDPYFNMICLVQEFLIQCSSTIILSLLDFEIDIRFPYSLRNIQPLRICDSEFVNCSNTINVIQQLFQSSIRNPSI